MKKFFVFILIVLVLAGFSFLKASDMELLSLNNIEKVCFISSEKFDVDEVVTCGDKYFNSCELNMAKNKFDEFLEKSDSFQLYFEDLTYEELSKNLKFQQVSFEKICGIDVYCGFTPYANKSLFLNGKKINAQIAVMQGKVIAGFPMILSGY